EWFDIDDVNKGAARFDFAKLESINAHYIRAKDDRTLFDELNSALPHLPKGDQFAARLEPEKAAQVFQALPVLKERAKTLNDLIDGAEFVLAKRPMPVEAAAAAVLDAGARRTLAAILPSLATLPDWSA